MNEPTQINDLAGNSVASFNDKRQARLCLQAIANCIQAGIVLTGPECSDIVLKPGWEVANDNGRTSIVCRPTRRS